MNLEPSPLILTLQLNPEAFAFFNDLRKKYFPPPINYLDAHLTLFHHLPPSPAINILLEKVVANQKELHLEVSGLMKLGRGVAYRIKSNELIGLHEDLREEWLTWLTPQDKKKLNPHITVQNKVDAATANTLYHELAAANYPLTAVGIGLTLWAYKGGPWHKIKDYSFKPAVANQNQ